MHRLRSLFRRRRDNLEFDEEMSEHVRMLAERYAGQIAARDARGPDGRAAE